MASFYYDGSHSSLQIKANEGKELVIERHSHAHVLYGYLDVVDDWLHPASPSDDVRR
jgi:hypothetical protein